MTDLSTPSAHIELAPKAVQTLVEKLLRHARAACKARAAEQTAQLDKSEAAIERVLQPLLDAPSAQTLNHVLSQYFHVCGEANELGDTVDFVVEVLQEMCANIELISADESNDTPTEGARLFALSMVVPVDGRQWSQPLSPAVLGALTRELLSAGLLGVRHDIAWLPVPLSFQRAMELSEWTVHRLTLALSCESMPHLPQLLTLLEQQQAETLAEMPGPGDQRILMETRLLVGVVKGPWEGAFPKGEYVQEALANAKDEDEADAVVSEVQAELEELGAKLAPVFNVSEMQVCTETRGWWADTRAVHQLMRTVHAQQQLQSILATAGLEADEVLACSELEPLTREPIGMGVHLFKKDGLEPLPMLCFAAMPSETPQDCAEEALAFIRSHPLALYEGALEDFQMGAEQAPVRSLH